MKNENFSRRHFLNLGVAVTTLGYFGLRPQIAKASAMPLLQGASLALGLMGSFSSSGGGLSAMLRAQNEMLKVISEQLNDIQRGLAELGNLIVETGEKNRAFINQALLQKEISKIVGGTKLFLEKLEASSGNDNYFSGSEVRDELRFIRNEVSLIRTSIQSISGGLGADAALILPIACALETAVRLRLGEELATVKASLQGYLSWANSILGNDVGSINSSVNDLIGDNNTIVDRLPMYRLTVQLHPDQLRIERNASPEKAHECYVSTVVEMDQNLDATGVPVDKVRQQFTRWKWPFYSYYRQLHIVSFVHNDLKAIQFKLEEVPGSLTLGADYSGGNVVGSFPHRGLFCITGPVATRGMSLDDVQKLMTSGPKHKAFEAQRVELESKIAEINLVRAKIAYHALARPVVKLAQNEISARLSRI